MDSAQISQAVNDNFRQVESENRTKIMKDEQGNSRVILGRLPDGTYALVISKPGYDVVKVLEGQQ